MSGWLNHHLQAIKLVLARFGRNALSTFMIFLVFALALCLPTLFYVAVDHLNSLTRHFTNETEVSVFLTLDANASQRQALEALLRNQTSIKSITFVGKDEAWQDLQAKMRLDEQQAQQAILALKQNPLPDAFFIKMQDSRIESRQSLQATLLSQPAVAEVIVNAQWVEKLNNLLALGKKLTHFVALLLVGVLLIMVGNTIRMQIITQHAEIEVSKLMGATNQFIKVPFLYAGALYGLFGGLLALALVFTMLFSMHDAIETISALYQSDFKLHVAYVDISLMVLSVAVTVGWLGAYIGVSRAISSFRTYQ